MERRDYVAKPTSAAIIDSQTVKTTEKGGYGLAKKSKGVNGKFRLIRKVIF